MEIKIVKDSFTDVLERNRTRWNLAHKKNLFYFTFYALGGLFVLAIAALGAKNTADFWGVFSSLGLGLIFLSTYYFLHTFQNKGKYLAGIKALTAQANNKSQHTELVLKDDLVTYKDLETYSEWKWSVFSSYMLHQDYLFLVMGNSVLNSIIIQKNEVSADEFAELVNFCSGHLYLKK
jgi:hypothetical protein